MRTLLTTFLALTAWTTCCADVKFHVLATDDREADRVVYAHGQRIRIDNTNTGEVSIRQCDLGRTVQLDANSKTYRVFPLGSMRAAPPAPTAAVSASDSSVPSRRIDLEEIGVGEFQGRPAQHLRILVYLASGLSPEHPQSPWVLVQERDGWYVEIPLMPECSSRQNEEGDGMLSFDQPERFVRSDGSITPELLPVYVNVKIPDKARASAVDHMVQVLSLSTEPLDPDLFDIPPDYRLPPEPDCSHGPTVVAKLGDGTPVYRAECGISPPRVTYQTEPEFSEKARRKKIGGTVQLSFVVDQFGNVRDIKVERALNPGLDRNATAAVSKWKFQPATRDGQAVAVQTKVEVTFSLY